MTKPLREEAKFIGTRAGQKDGGRGRQSLLCDMKGQALFLKNENDGTRTFFASLNIRTYFVVHVLLL